MYDIVIFSSGRQHAWHANAKQRVQLDSRVRACDGVRFEAVFLLEAAKHSCKLRIEQFWLAHFGIGCLRADFRQTFA